MHSRPFDFTPLDNPCQTAPVLPPKIPILAIVEQIESVMPKMPKNALVGLYSGLLYGKIPFVDILTLRDLINSQFGELHQELEYIVSLIRKMADKSLPELDGLKFQVSSLAEGMIDLEERVRILEQHTGLARWVARQIGTIAVIVIVVWLIGLLR